MSSWPARASDGALRARLRLARRIFRVHYAQPATGLWRLFEAEVVLAHLGGRGRGLDLGCGDGTLATVLLSGARAIRWTGLDLDPRDATLARGSGVYDTVHTASATGIPEPDETFDVVFSNSALEHMDDLDRVLAEVRRVLRTGGRFVFTVPERGFHRALLWPRVLRRLGRVRAAERYTQHLDQRLAHRNYFSAEEWRTRLAPHGLRTITCLPYLSRRTIGWWETLANLTGGLTYVLAGGRLTPRQIQHATGLAGSQRAWIGTLVLWTLLPIVVLVAAEREPRTFGCLYVEAVREA